MLVSGGYTLIPEEPHNPLPEGASRIEIPASITVEDKSMLMRWKLFACKYSNEF